MHVWFSFCEIWFDSMKFNDESFGSVNEIISLPLSPPPKKLSYNTCDVLLIFILILLKIR